MANIVVPRLLSLYKDNQARVRRATRGDFVHNNNKREMP